MRTSIEWGIGDEDWRTLLDGCAGATFFHTPGWYRARAGALGGRLATARLTFEDGAVALLPLATRRLYRGLVTGAASGLENGYGGLLSPSPLSARHVETAYQKVAGRFGHLEVIGNPHGPASPMPTGEGEADATQLLPLLPPEAQLARMSGMRARHVRKAAKEGFRLEVRRGPTGEDAALFFDLYRAHAGRWAYTRWVRDEAFFRAMLEAAGPDMVLFLAHQDADLAAFHLVGVTGEVAIQLNLASDEAFDRANVGTWLIAESLGWLHGAGYRTFDFLPSGQLEGVRAYKASFGAEAGPFETRRQVDWRGRTLGAIARWRQPRWAPSA